MSYLRNCRKLASRLAPAGLLLAGCRSPDSPTAVPGEDRPAEAAFHEVAGATGLDFVHFNGMSGELYFLENMGSGAGLFDFDNDGDLDLYLVQGAMLGAGRPAEEATFPPLSAEPPKDRLYRNDLVVEPGGAVPRWVEVTERSRIRAPGYGMGVAAGDYDNDGWVDLYVTNWGANQLWHNEGDGSFRDATEDAGVGGRDWSTSASFLDFDRDGWLDLYVANYVDFRYAVHRVCATPGGAPDYCGPLAFEPRHDRLYRNRGDGTFEDVSAAALRSREPANGLGVVAADFDGDGWPDIYVANDSMANDLWMNQRDGSFSNQALLAGCALSRDGLPEGSMGLDAGDLDDDGDEDLFLAHTNKESNTLYVNRGGGLFEDRTAAAGLGLPSWGYTAYAAAWLDYDNDGWLDLLTANGSMRVIEEQASGGDPYPLRQTNQLFHNLGDGAFEEISRRAGEAFSVPEVSRGAAFGDIDNDGDTDVLISNSSGPPRLLANRRGDDGSWLGLRLLTETSHRHALGSRARIAVAGGAARWRRVRTDGSYCSANDPRILVGLGSGGPPASVRIHWLDGGVRELVLRETELYLVVYRDGMKREPDE